MKTAFLTSILFYSQLVLGQVNLDSGLVAWYPFEGNAIDSSVNSNDGIVNGATQVPDRLGNPNSAYYFDGFSSHIDVPHDPSLSFTEYTLYAIVKVEGFFSGNCQGNIILWKGKDTYSGHYGLIFSDTPYDNSCFSFDSLHDNFYNDQQHLNPPADTPYVQMDTWYCLISTFDGDSIKMYVDGVLRYTGYRNPLGANFEPLTFGYNFYVPGLEYWFHGVLDDIRIYDRVLNENERDALCFSTSLPVAAFTSPYQICPGTCVGFTNLSQNATSYIWSFPGASPSSSTDPDPSSICYTTPGSYDVILIASNAAGSDTLLLNNYMTVYPYSPSQSILQNADTLTSNTGFVSYQWFLNGDTINGATQNWYVASQNGDYSVVCLDSNGCSVEAVLQDVVAAVPFAESPDFNITPNPVQDLLIIEGGNRLKIEIYNIHGGKVYESVSTGFYHSVSLKRFPPGLYFLKINSDEGRLRVVKIIKE